MDVGEQFPCLQATATGKYSEQLNTVHTLALNPFPKC
jgi:hypothetical protein